MKTIALLIILWVLLGIALASCAPDIRLPAGDPWDQG